MEMRLIHADESLTELGEVDCFEQFDAQIGLETGDGHNDWMLQLPERMWQERPVLAGHYIYIDGTEWGGVAERVHHTGSEGMVRVYGTCWRGMLEGRVVCPPPGETHLVLEDEEGNAALGRLLGGWNGGLFSVESGGSGLTLAGAVRYRTLTDALAGLLGEDGRLRVRFSDRRVRLSLAPVRDRSAELELSQEYEAGVISDALAGRCNHILALGRGEMLERTVVERWALPDGSVTGDADAQGVPAEAETVTYLYDYPSVESDAELAAAAEKKLRELRRGGSMEIELPDSETGLELTDRASVRDSVTGMTAVLTVTGIRLNISEDRTSFCHTLEQR